ncbi:hypothetical protein D3248_07090 [Leucobacter zeae]|nr:hypothetical protein [Leucobacter zeae]
MPRTGAVAGTPVRAGGGGLLKRYAGALLAILLLAGGIVTGTAPAAEALPRGESVSLPGGIVITNYVMPNGRRAYCVEISMSEPSGYASGGGRTTYLPGREGKFPGWRSTEGMRQMNYLIDTHGQTRNAWTAAAVQVTIWRMRENFTQSNAQLNRTIATLQQSRQGRELLAKSDALYADAKRRAKAPVAPKRIAADGFRLEVDPAGVDRRYRISYPKGTTKLAVVGAKFVRNGRSTITVDPDAAAARYATIDRGAKRIEATGSWASDGIAGWDAALHLYGTTNASGALGQRIAVATGKSLRPRLTGEFPRRIAVPEPEPGPPTASSQAQPSATVGGTMGDTLVLAPAADGPTRIWPGAVADFTAYLLPVAGASKYTDEWEPVLGEAHEVQAEDPETGEPVWREWWADRSGVALLDGSGKRIPRLGADGTETAGTAADGTEYPVALIDDAGEPVRGADGEIRFSVVREPVTEERRDPVLWTERELAAMSPAARCVAQPVHRQGGIPITRAGRISSAPVEVRSAGTVHWVERISSPAGEHHVGRCGLPNETTRIGQPGVVTRAQATATVGDAVTDVASVSGAFAPHATYTLRFEAFGSAASGDEVQQPVCDASTRIFRSDAVPVPGPGDYRSPEVTVRWAHGTRIWWVETLSIETDSGARVLHRGACGLENETTTVERPTVRTEAKPSAVSGDLLTDTAVIAGGLAETRSARWEIGFEAFREAYDTVDDRSDPARKGEEPVEAPVCAADNRIFATEPRAVTGPGDVVSEPVIAKPEWAGAIWWVETLWLIEGERRTPVHRGECGLPNETTELTTPEVVTRATGFVAVGGKMRDTATVTGPLAAREGAVHEIVFEGYRGDAGATGTGRAACTDRNRLFATDPVVVERAGDVPSPEVVALPEFGETVWWVETLRLRVGTEVQVLSRGTCGLPDETTTVQFPVVRTESAGTVAVGDELFDTAIVGGVFPERDGLEFRVVFRAYERAEDVRMECAPERELTRFSDHDGVVVTGPGKYESRRVRTSADDIGLGGFVETLVMVEDGKEHVVAAGACGAPSERFAVTSGPERPLPRTGGSGDVPLLVGAGALLVGSAVVLSARLVRRRKEGGRGV